MEPVSHRDRPLMGMTVSQFSIAFLTSCKRSPNGWSDIYFRCMCNAAHKRLLITGNYTYMGI